MNKMKKAICGVIGIMMLCLTGCSDDKTQSTDEGYFENVKSVELSYNGVVKEKSKIEQIEKIIDKLDLTKTDKKMEEIDGNYFLIITYEDDSEKTISFTSGLIELDGETYEISNDICDEIKEIFE